MQIQTTRDYQSFKRISGNRELNHSHVNKLIEAIQSDPQSVTYNPILVNENDEIIDGQHRLEAIKHLGLPVHYMKVNGLNLNNVQLLNALTKGWSPMDYAKSFAELGNNNYQIYIDFKNQYNLNHDILMKFLAYDIPMTTEAFKHGKFEVQNVDLTMKLCEELTELSTYYKKPMSRNIAFGFWEVWRSKEYNHSRMVQQLDAYGDQIQDQTAVFDYAREFERVYNYRQRNQYRLI